MEWDLGFTQAFTQSSLCYDREVVLLFPLIPILRYNRFAITQDARVSRDGGQARLRFIYEVTLKEVSSFAGQVC